MLVAKVPPSCTAQMQSMVELGGNPFIPRIFQTFDTDGDGKVSCGDAALDWVIPLFPALFHTLQFPHLPVRPTPLRCPYALIFSSATFRIIWML